MHLPLPPPLTAERGFADEVKVLVVFAYHFVAEHCRVAPVAGSECYLCEVAVLELQEDNLRFQQLEAFLASADDGSGSIPDCEGFVIRGFDDVGEPFIAGG